MRCTRRQEKRQLRTQRLSKQSTPLSLNNKYKTTTKDVGIRMKKKEIRDDK